MKIFKDKDGIIKFEGLVRWTEYETKSVEVDGEKYTKTLRFKKEKLVSDFKDNEFRINEFYFKDINVKERINEMMRFSLFPWYKYSQNKNADLIMRAFEEGLLDSKIIDVYSGKGYINNDYNVSEGYYSFKLFSYGFNNSIYYSVKIDDLHDMDSIRPWHRDKLKNHYKVLNQPRCYILKDENTGMYKIGKSKNPKNREKTLQSEKPTIKMIKTFSSDIESKLHNIYKSQRVRGEWFNLTKLQVHYICTHY